MGKAQDEDFDNEDETMSDEETGMMDFDDEGAISDDTQPAARTDHTARMRLEALRERQALRRAIYDDLYQDDDLGDD